RARGRAPCLRRLGHAGGAGGGGLPAVARRAAGHPRTPQRAPDLIYMQNAIRGLLHLASPRDRPAAHSETRTLACSGFAAPVPGASIGMMQAALAPSC